MAVKIDRLEGKWTTDETEILNRMLRDLGRAVNGFVTPSNQLPEIPPGSGTDNHHLLTHLTDFDDHPQYLYLAGRPGGQTARGGTANSESLALSSTSAATKGKILLGLAGDVLVDEAQKRVGVKVTAPVGSVHIKGEPALTIYTHLIGDVTVPVGWTKTGGSTFYENIDEDALTFFDSDIIQSDSPPGTGQYEGSLATVPNVGSLTIKLRAKCTSGSQQIDLLLIEGVTSRATLVITLTNTFANYTYTLSPAEFAAIGNFANLRLRFGRGGHGQVSQYQMSAAWVETPGGAGGKTLVSQAVIGQQENLFDALDSSGGMLVKVLVNGNMSIHQDNTIDAFSGNFPTLYLRSLDVAREIGLVIECSPSQVQDIFTAYQPKVGSNYGGKICGIDSQGEFYIQGHGQVGIGPSAGINLSNLGVNLIEAYRDIDSFTDVIFSATLSLGWNDATSGGVITGKDHNSKLKRLGISINEGVMIGNAVRTSLTPPAALSHVKNYSGAGNIVAIDEAVAGQTADIHQFKKNGALLSAIDANGNFTGGVTPAAGSITPSMIQDRTRRIFIPNSMWVQSNGTTLLRAIGGTHPNTYEYFEFPDAPVGGMQALELQMMIPEDYSSSMEMFVWWREIAAGAGVNSVFTWDVYYKFLASGDNPVAAGSTISTDIFNGADYTHVFRTSVGVINVGIATGKLLRLVVGRNTAAGDDSTDKFHLLMTELVYTADS